MRALQLLMLASLVSPVSAQRTGVTPPASARPVSYSVTGEAYLLLGSGQVVAAAGSQVYFVPELAAKAIEPRVLAAALFSSDSSTALPSGSIDAELVSYAARFRTKAAAYVSGTNDPRYANINYPWKSSARELSAVFALYLSGDFGALLDSHLTAAAATPGDSAAGRWRDEFNATPTNETMHFMLQWLVFLGCQKRRDSLSGCDQVLAGPSLRASQLELLDKLKVAAVVCRVGIDGKFSASLPGPGTYIAISTYANLANHGVWRERVELSRTKPSATLVLNGDNFSSWPK